MSNQPLSAIDPVNSDEFLTDNFLGAKSSRLLTVFKKTFDAGFDKGLHAGLYEWLVWYEAGICALELFGTTVWGGI